MAIYDPLNFLDNLPPAPKGGLKKWKWNGKEWVLKKPALPGKPDKPAATTASSGGGSGGGGGGYSGGGSGGGGGSTGLSTYIQEYRLRFHTDGTPGAGLLGKAKTNNWSLAYFDMQVRLHDPTYFRSKEAKTLLPKFNKTMKVLFPGLATKDKQRQLMQSSFYKKTALWYLKNGVGLSSGGGMEALYGRITNTNRWNKQNPYWKDYARNKNIGVAAESDPVLYKAYLDTLKQSFSDTGMALPDDYYHTFFQSRYASKSGISDMQSNLKQIAEQGGSYGWWQGKGMGTGQVKTAALDSEATGTDLRSRLAKSFGVRKSFLGTDQKSFDTQLTNKGKLVNPLI